MTRKATITMDLYVSDCRSDSIAEELWHLLAPSPYLRMTEIKVGNSIARRNASEIPGYRKAEVTP